MVTAYVNNVKVMILGGIVMTEDINEYQPELGPNQLWYDPSDDTLVEIIEQALNPTVLYVMHRQEEYWFILKKHLKDNFTYIGEIE